jgi:hypothetical protein
MSKFNPHDPAHVLARHLSINISDARDLLRTGAIPDRDPARQLCRDTAWLRAVEAVRPQFDTPVTVFLWDIRDFLIRQLLYTRTPEDSAPNRRLVEFRFHAFGECGEPAYPVDRNVRPWRGHRVPVSREQLIRAGYVEFHELWSRWGGPRGSYSTPEEHAFANVKHGGEVQLSPFQAYWSNTWTELYKPRGEFLERLCQVLDADREHYL